MTTTLSSLDGDAPKQRRVGPVALVAIAVVMSLPQVGIALWAVPGLTQVLRDLLGDRPLPWMTAFAINGQWLFVGFAFVWSLGAWSLVNRSGSTRGLYLMLAVPIIPVILTTIGLMLPLLPLFRSLKPPQ
jgi:hypothetical protein